MNKIKVQLREKRKKAMGKITLLGGEAIEEQSDTDSEPEHQNENEEGIAGSVHTSTHNRNSDNKLLSPTAAG